MMALMNEYKLVNYCTRAVLDFLLDAIAHLENELLIRCDIVSKLATSRDEECTISFFKLKCSRFIRYCVNLNRYYV
jgi:hypothetical protein